MFSPETFNFPVLEETWRKKKEVHKSISSFTHITSARNVIAETEVKLISNTSLLLVKSSYYTLLVLTFYV